MYTEQEKLLSILFFTFYTFKGKKSKNIGKKTNHYYVFHYIFTGNFHIIMINKII